MSCGIYKIQNKKNNKIYIGQSTNCERRLKEHCYPSRYLSGLPIDYSIKVNGKENFTYEIIEECDKDKLNEREEYWIAFYQSNGKNGYNCNPGGSNQSIGENNGRAILTEKDIIEIRTAYSNHERKKETYEKYKNKITFGNFESVWEGRTWLHIMPEVYTKENKEYYSVGAGCISNGNFSDEEIINFRKEYVTKTAKEIYEALEDKRVTFNSFQRLLSGQTFKHLPYYLKKTKVWVQPGEIPPKASENRGKHQKRTNLFSDEEIINFRKNYVKMTAKEIYEKYNLKELISFDSFQKILRGATYTHLPYYSKTSKEWINPVSTISVSGE